MNIRVVKSGRNFEKGMKLKPAKNPYGYNTDLSGTNSTPIYDWQLGALEQVEGAYSKAMLTQYMSNIAIKANMRNLYKDAKAVSKDSESMASVSDVSNSINGNGGNNGSFQQLQNTIGNINSLQKMQADANKKYNAAVSNYESTEADIKSKGEAVSSLQEEKNTIDNMANGGNAFMGLLNSDKTKQTLVTMAQAGAKRQEAIDSTKEVRTGFCYIVTKDNKIGQVIAKENEPFKVTYDILYKR